MALVVNFNLNGAIHFSSVFNFLIEMFLQLCVNYGLPR